ncbi:hypothetical protein V6N13_029235 [Hibiscus sabdariffa]
MIANTSLPREKKGAPLTDLRSEERNRRAKKLKSEANKNRTGPELLSSWGHWLCLATCWAVCFLVEKCGFSF